MRINSKSILLILACLLIITVGYRFNEYVIKDNYIILSSLECNTSNSDCFVWDCSVEEEADCDRTPYKKIEVKAYDAPRCLLENNCEEFICENYDTCSVVICSEESTAYWEACALPSDFPVETVVGVEDESSTLEKVQI